MTETIKNIDEEKVKETSLTLCESADKIVVTDQDSYEKASFFLKTIKDGRKFIVGYFKDLKEPAHEAWKAIVKREKEELEPIDNAERKVKNEMVKYVNEQEKIRREEERKAQEEADRKAEIERKKLLKQAEKAEAKGDSEKAEEKQQEAEEVYSEPVAVAPKVEKTTRINGGGTVSTRKDIEIILPESDDDIKAFCKAVAEGSIPTACVKFAPVYIKQWAKLTKKLGRVFGLTIKETTGLSVR